MQFLRYRTNCHEPYDIFSWRINKNLSTPLEITKKKYVFWNSENFELTDGQLFYDPFFVSVYDKNNIDLNLKIDTLNKYVLVFDTLEEIKKFKLTEQWRNFKNKNDSKIRRVFIYHKSPEEYIEGIDILKILGQDISECGYTLFDILSMVLKANLDKKVTETLKSNKEIKRLIQNGAVKIRLNDGWATKNNVNEYFLPNSELIFRIGKNTFFRIK